MILPANLAVAWTKGLEESRKEDFEKLVRNSTTVLSKVKQILTEWESELSNTETNVKEYDNPSWSHKQAHYNGERAAYKKVRQLFNFLG